MSSDTACDAVQFHAVELGLRHGFWQEAEEVANAAGGLQDVPGLEAHVPDGGIHSLDDSRTGVVGVQDAGLS